MRDQAAESGANVSTLPIKHFLVNADLVQALRSDSEPLKVVGFNEFSLFRRAFPKPLAILTETVRH